MSINGLDDSDARTLLLKNVPGASGRSASVELTWLCTSSRSVLRLELDPA